MSDDKDDKLKEHLRMDHFVSLTYTEALDPQP